ncbi:uncharacterized protein LOC104898608 [Beta vulgaris subsp. vulgaris]|uniref:uncharacterized protein LOC104898608 n=1 Tax=Beta vulgaris subsp. vulgaris TaxID=3555 RepID=UPI002036D754|nr:uncharacterized protein LOC104898608 [Beta vulgaris subsp. vulgaris]
MASDSSDDYDNYGYNDDSDYESYSATDDDEVLKLAIEKLTLGPKKNKLLVFSLNGLLLHRAHKLDKSSIPANRCPDGVYNGNRFVYKRPFLDEFMKFCLDRFEVGIWSSAQEHNVDAVMDCAFKGFSIRFLFIWDQDQCNNSGLKSLENKKKPLFFKELSKLCSSLANSSRGACFSDSNTLLIDDEPYKGLLNPPHTGIYPDSYDPNDVNDNALDPKEELGEYLKGLVNAEDVPSYVKEHPFGQPAIGPLHPHWDFYSKIRRLKKDD